MASIVKETVIDTPAGAVWAAVREFGAVHRLASGFVVDCRLDGETTRVVTFASGAVAREVLVAVDDEARRLVYSIVESPLGLTHDNSSVQVVAEGDGRSRFVWTKDLLPDEAAPRVAELMEQGIGAIRQTFEGRQVATGD